MSIFTIGHSANEIGKFLTLLNSHKIEVVADVRSAPYSQWQPHYNREHLSAILQKNNIKYIFLGKELGGRSDDPRCHVDGRVSYQDLAKTEMMQDALRRVVEIGVSDNIALMCSEKDPLNCHRAVLIAKELAELDKEVLHILADGTLESHFEAEKRIFHANKVPEKELFLSHDELRDMAYKLQGNRIAYRVKSNEKVVGQ